MSQKSDKSEARYLPFCCRRGKRGRAAAAREGREGRGVSFFILWLIPTATGGKLMSAFQIYDALPCTLNVDFVPAETLWKANHTEKMEEKKIWSDDHTQHRHMTFQASTIKAANSTYRQLVQTFDVRLRPPPFKWKMNIIFVWPWTSDSEDQSSISSNRTNKSEFILKLTLCRQQMSQSTERSHILSPSQCGMNLQVTYCQNVFISYIKNKMTFNLSTLFEIERLLFQADGGQAAF